VYNKNWLIKVSRLDGMSSRVNTHATFTEKAA